MAIWNLGSINADYVYSVANLPSPGETLSSLDRQVFLGGKGANMSVAAARAGATVNHIGAVGADGKWAVDRLSGFGVQTENIVELSDSTGHAIIAVDQSGENSIILHGGANTKLPMSAARAAIEKASAGDWFVCQNETNLQEETMKLAAKNGLKLAYAAAPFDATAVEKVLPYLSFLILNEIEMEQLTQATGKSADQLDLDTVIVTLGAAGANLYSRDNNHALMKFDAIKVTPIDTTGAGDTFTGYVLASLDSGKSIEAAIDTAMRAGALMVTRQGTADVIPSIAEVEAFSP